MTKALRFCERVILIRSMRFQYVSHEFSAFTANNQKIRTEAFPAAVLVHDSEAPLLSRWIS